VHLQHIPHVQCFVCKHIRLPAIWTLRMGNVA
jgi:hypothetical protein